MTVIPMRKIITYGTFDYFHYGHFMLLSRARKLGDYLIVGLSTDGFNSQKNKKSILSFSQRKEVLESFKFVDLVITENSWIQKKGDILNYGIHTLVMGSDWTGKFDDLKTYCNVIYLERTPSISSSLIRSIL